MRIATAASNLLRARRSSRTVVPMRERERPIREIADCALERLRSQPVDLSLLSYPRPDKPAAAMTNVELKITAAHALARLQGVGLYGDKHGWKGVVR